MLKPEPGPPPLGEVAPYCGGADCCFSGCDGAGDGNVTETGVDGQWTLV